MNLHSHPFLACFPPGRAKELAAQATILQIDSPVILFEENSPSDCLYLTLEGEVVLMKTMAERPVDIATVRAGDFFGELGLLDGSPRSTAARVDRPATLARIGESAFQEALSGAPAETFRALVRRINQSLRETNEKLLSETLRKEKTALVGEMANTIIHDIRSPFTVIDLAAQMIAEQHTDPATRRFCTMIEQQIRSVTGMVEEILEFSRGVPSLKLEPVPVDDLFSAFAAANSLRHRKSSLSLEIRSSPATILCDREKMLRLLQNLFNNSAEALAGKPGRIELSATNSNGTVKIRIADNGPGIPEAIRANLFEPFVTCGKAKGTGLGLSIVKSVIAAHGGTVSVETASDRGTVFILTLPATP